MQLFSAASQAFVKEWAVLQLFSAGGEESPWLELPAAPGREITAGKAVAKEQWPGNNCKHEPWQK